MREVPTTTATTNTTTRPPRRRPSRPQRGLRTSTLSTSLRCGSGAARLRAWPDRVATVAALAAHYGPRHTTASSVRLECHSQSPGQSILPSPPNTPLRWSVCSLVITPQVERQDARLPPAARLAAAATRRAGEQPCAHARPAAGLSVVSSSK